MGSIHIKEKRCSVGQQPPPSSRSSSEELDFREETATRAFAETTPAMPLHSQPTAPPAQPADLVIIEEPKPKKIRLFGQTRRALSPHRSGRKLLFGALQNRDGNVIEFSFTGGKRLADSTLKYMQKHVLGETGNILLTAGGNFQIKAISEIKVPPWLTLDNIQLLRDYGLADHQIVRFLDSKYLSSALTVGPFHKTQRYYDPEFMRERVSELAAVGLYEMAAREWNNCALCNKITDVEDGWTSDNKWFKATEARLLKRLQRYGVTCKAESAASGFDRLQELFCLVLCHRPKPDPLQACKIVLYRLHSTPTDCRSMVMTELCKLATTPEDAVRFKAHLISAGRPPLAEKWLGRLDLRARELEEQAAYKEYNQALDRLQAEASLTFDFNLDGLEVRIEPEDHTSIGHLSSQILKDLKIVANGFFLADQLERALGAFRLLWRDACASLVAHTGGPKYRKADDFRQELLKRSGESADPDSITKRIDEIVAEGFDEFKVFKV